MSAQTTTSKQRVALITGSSAGIGAAIATELHNHGYCVIINHPPFDADRTSARELCSTLSQDRSFAVEADLSLASAPQQLVASTIENFGRLDVLVNNVGFALALPFTEHSLEDWNKLIDLNARGPFLLTQAVLPHFEENTKRGETDNRIVNIIGTSARSPPPFQSLYSGTKGMMDSFTRAWAKELPRQYGVTVNAVSPGPTRTPGTQGTAGQEQLARLSDGDRQKFEAVINSTPVGPRFAEANEIAHVVAFLCEPKTRWVNGAHLHVNGGLFIE